MKKLELIQMQQIQEMIADKLGCDVEEVHDEALIKDELGADSLDEVEIVMELEKMYDIEIPDSDYEDDHLTVKSYYVMVEKNLI